MENKIDVAVYGYISDGIKEKLNAISPRFRFIYEPDADAVSRAEIVMGSVPPALLAHAKNMKWLQLSMAGVEQYTVPGVVPENVIITNATGAFGLAISEYMVGCSLTLIKKLHLYRDNMARHVWLDRGNVGQIEDSVVLTVGVGDIGGAFAKKMKALGAYTVGVRRTVSDKPEWLDEVWTTERLDEILPRADIVGLCMPNTAQTRGMFDRARLEKMKESAILLNVGRGNAVDTTALAELLESGRLGGAALDVTDPEPLPAAHPLWNCENALITPHVSGFYHLPKTYVKIMDIYAENLVRYLQGETLLHQVDRETGYCKKELS